MLPSNTTLINPKSSAQSSNPNVYAANRNQHFESLRGQAAVKAEQSVDITRNARVGYYLSQYNKLKQQLNQQEREQKATISSDSFDTIFSKKITKFEQ